MSHSGTAAATVVFVVLFVAGLDGGRLAGYYAGRAVMAAAFSAAAFRVAAGRWPRLG